MASLGNDNIRRAIQNTTGIVNAIRQAQAGQPTIFNLPMPKYNGEQMQAKSGGSTPTGEHRNAARFNPASAVSRVMDKADELDLPGRNYIDDTVYDHAYGTRPELPRRSIYNTKNERRKGDILEDFVNHSIYNIANGPGQILETGTVPRSYVTMDALKRIWPKYSEIPLDARLTPEQWLRGAKSDVYRYLGGGA